MEERDFFDEKAEQRTHVMTCPHCGQQGEYQIDWVVRRKKAQLPRGAVVVNAARGTLVDDAALIAALQTGQVGYAGLDVYDGEPNVHPGYLALENVVLLPHLGSATVATRDAMGFLALDGIDAVLAGRTPGNLVR